MAEKKIDRPNEIPGYDLKTKGPPPPLVLPPEKRVAGTPQEAREYFERLKRVEKPLPLRYVQGFDFYSLLINVLVFALLYLIPAVLLARKGFGPGVIHGTSAIIVWIALLPNLLLQRLWTTVKGRKCKVYTDNISRIMNAYVIGFHFVSIFSTKEDDEIDFQRHVTLIMCIRFESQDGYGVEANLTAVYSKRNSQEALSRSLRYDNETLGIWAQAVIYGSLSDLGARNGYASLLYYKYEVAKHISQMFGGEGMLSDFELDTGTTFKDPVVKDIDLDEKSKEVFRLQSKYGAIANGVKTLIAAGVSEDQATDIAQATEGAVQKIIHQYKGIPEGISAFSGGDAGIAFAANTKKGKT